LLRQNKKNFEIKFKMFWEVAGTPKNKIEAKNFSLKKFFLSLGKILY